MSMYMYVYSMSLNACVVCACVDVVCVWYLHKYMCDMCM